VQANGFRGRYDLVLNDYRTVNPAANVCLQSPPNDRDAWIYRDTADSSRNWGIYHRQIDAPVAGLPGNSIGFIGGDGSKLQAFVNLADGSAFFAGKLIASSYTQSGGGVNAATMEIGGPNPVANGSGGAVLYLHHHGVLAHQLRYNNGTLFFEAAGNGYGSSTRPTLALAGDVSLEGKHALRGNDTWLRLNQDGAFPAGVHTPGNFAPGALNVGGVNGYGNPGGGNAWIAGALTVKGAIVPAVGNSEAAGIQFPGDPGLGGGDRAFIRYYVESGETTKLLIGNNNDADDRISLYQMSAERLTVYNGCVGINTISPGAALDVNATTSTWGGWLEAIRFSRPEHSAITHPGGKLLFGLHGNRNFYFADTNAGRYVMTVSADSGNVNVLGEIEATGAWIKVTGGGSEMCYLGGDGAGNDVQVGSTKAGVITLAAYNWANGYMDVAGRNWLGHSDARSKENVEPVVGALGKLLRLRAVSFDWKNGVPGGIRSKNVGFIAQEVRQVIPEAVAELRDASLSIAYNSIVALLVEAIKEQQMQIDELRAAVKR
jgi:hypothetical protein